MTDIDAIIRKRLNLLDFEDVSSYKNLEERNNLHQKIAEIINEYIPKIESKHNPKDEAFLKKNGYVVFENFLDEKQVDSIVNYISDKPGYNFHIPNRAFSSETKTISENIDWNILSYNTDLLLQNEIILKIMTDEMLISLVQSYFGCMPTIHMLSMWWSIFTGEVFHTQKIHRDGDDYKFLSLLIYLNDIDENNGPHIFYPGTHNGSDDTDNKLVILGKAGTAVLADTFAWHHGAPLNEGKRLLMFNRYGLFKNNNYFRDKSFLNMQSEETFFSKIDDNVTNRHLLRLFTK
jgi:hypothetical protein